MGTKVRGARVLEQGQHLEMPGRGSRLLKLQSICLIPSPPYIIGHISPKAVLEKSGVPPSKRYLGTMIDTEAQTPGDSKATWD